MAELNLIELAELIRDTTHNLDLSTPSHHEYYKECIKRFLILVEGERNVAYCDKTGESLPSIHARGGQVQGNVSIGVGFNMEGEGARGFWFDALGGEVSFDKAFAGKLKITKEQIGMLLDLTLDKKIKKTIKLFQPPVWNEFRPNEKITLAGLVFNSDKLLNQNTNLYRQMVLYAQTGNPKYLSEARKEIEFRSNPNGIKGVQNRRNAEALMIDSTLCPFYVSGTAHQFPKELKTVYAAKTRMPRGMPVANHQKFDEFFVWRTQLDSKVRYENLKKEGLIYRKDNLASEDMPGGKHNCRCWAEPVPDVECIIENKSIDTLRILELRVKLLEIGIIFAQRGMHTQKQIICNIMRECKSLLK